jgi:branched-chain amino acid transport system permease protein
MGLFADYASQILIYAIFAVSLNLLVGYIGQVSIAHAAFGAIGGYTAALLALHAGISFWPSLALAALAAALAGVVIGTPALRLAPDYLILLTLAASATVTALIGSVDALGGEIGLNGVPVPEVFGQTLVRPTEWLPWLLLLFAVTLLVSLRIAKSPSGLLMLGIRENEVAARSLGKNVFAWKLSVFAATAAVAGMAGALLVYYGTVASPATFSLDQSMFIFAMLIVGGTGNLLGSVLGAALLVLLTPLLELVVHLPTDTAVLVRLRPQGLVPERRRGRRKAALQAASAETAGKARFAPVSLERLAEATEGGTSTDRKSGDPVLVVRNLRKSFGGITAINDLSLTLKRHTVTALVGPNGAGKTTVFSLVTGMLRPDSGSVYLNGADITATPPNRTAHRGMVRSFQDVKIFGRLTALENVMYAFPNQPGENVLNLFLNPIKVRNRNREIQEHALAWLEFVGLADKSHQLAGDLSFGDQRLVTLARTIASGADILLLDEPTSGMDTQWVDRMIELIRLLPSLGKTVCIVEHNLQVVERLSDEV